MQTLGIKLIAVLHWLRGLVYIVGGLAILGVTHLSARMIAAVANDTPLNRLTSAFGNAFAIAALVFALFWTVLGIGIWTMKNWARVLTLVLAGIWLLFGLLRLSHFATAPQFLRVAVDAAIIIYLLLPDVRRLFGASA